MRPKETEKYGALIFEMMDNCTCCSRKVRGRGDGGGNEMRKSGLRVRLKALVRGPWGGRSQTGRKNIYITRAQPCSSRRLGRDLIYPAPAFFALRFLFSVFGAERSTKGRTNGSTSSRGSRRESVVYLRSFVSTQRWRLRGGLSRHHAWGLG